MSSSTKILRNRKKQIIGYIESDSKGRKVLHDKDKNIIAYYYPLTNMSKDCFHNDIGTGDQLNHSLMRKLKAKYKKIDKSREGFGSMFEIIQYDD